MSRQITQPVNQVRLTNVAVVRMNRCGKRFELACYRNKMINYRQGVETDLSEVLQTTRVFTNVSKGEFAPSSALTEAFGTDDEDEVCRIVLARGQVQVSDRERNARHENAVREIAELVADRCVDPRSDRRYDARRVADAMRRAGFVVHPTRSAKQQFLDCVRLLKERPDVLPIERARMRLRVTSATPGDDEDLTTALRRSSPDLERVSFAPLEVDDEDGVVCLVDPSLYRVFDRVVKENDGWRLEILQHCVFEEGEIDLESEMERKENMTSRQEESKNNDDGDEVERLERAVRNDLTVAETNPGEINDTDDNDDRRRTDNDNYDHPRRKGSKKKSKKARRREKEEAAEREERREAERNRRKERTARSRTNNAGERCVVVNEQKVDDKDGGGGSMKSCNTCGGSFTVAEYRSHFRSDWHRFNIKLKMKGALVVSQQEFEACDADAFFEINT